MPRRTRRASHISLVLVALTACSSSSAEPPAAKPAVEASVEAPVEAPVSKEPGLSVEALKGVLDGAKVDVRRTCRPLARMRERIDVNLTISGPSGAVIHTNVSANGGNPELASCVANELARSTFPTAPRVTRTTVSINF